MKRMLRALGAFALTLALALGLSAAPLCAAAEAPDSSAGYLVMLNQDLPQASPLPVDPLGQATLLASDREREDLLAVSEDLGIYKINDLADIQNLVWSGQVSVVEPDYPAELLQLDLADPASPNDDRFTNGYQFNLEAVHVQSAWDAGLTGDGVTVAVIDTGITPDHLDAPVKIGHGRYYFYREEKGGKFDFVVNGVTRYYNYYSNDYVVDNLGHGTMVSGLIAANTNNRSADYTGGIAGMAPNVTILPIRCFTATPNHLGGYTSNLISGIDYAVANGADIINMSWGVRGESSTLKAAIDRASNAGCILIAASGNDGSGTIQYPAAYDNVISVGSTNKLGQLSDLSQRVTSVNVCAPGGSRGKNQIYSHMYQSVDKIAKGDGTSFSAPIVAGAAALLKEHDPTMTQADFMSLLKANSNPVATDSAEDQAYVGCGALDLRKLLDATGHTGVTLRRETDGSLTVRAAHHPKAADGTPPTNALVLIGAYNAAGHLLSSAVATSPLAGGYGAYSYHTTFQVPEAAYLQAFFLDNATLAPLAAPAQLPIEQ